MVENVGEIKLLALELGCLALQHHEPEVLEDLNVNICIWFGSLSSGRFSLAP